jgi:hypothetical protein
MLGFAYSFSLKAHLQQNKVVFFNQHLYLTQSALSELTKSNRRDDYKKIANSILRKTWRIVRQ